MSRQRAALSVGGVLSVHGQAGCAGGAGVWGWPQDRNRLLLQTGLLRSRPRGALRSRGPSSWAVPVCVWPYLPHVSRVPACPRVSVAPSPSGPGNSVLTWSLVSLPGPVLVSLRPGSQLLSHQPLFPERPLSNSMAPASPRLSSQTGQLAAEDAWRPRSLLEEKATRRAAEQRLEEKKTWFSNGFDIFECPPPKTENEV